MWRPQAPKQPTELAPVSFDAGASTLHLKIPLIPEPELLRRRRRLSGPGNVLDIVRIDGDEPAHALWPQRRHDTGGPAAPVIAGKHGAIDRKRVHQFAQIVAECRLLARARRALIKKTRRPETAQIRHNHAGVRGI